MRRYRIAQRPICMSPLQSSPRSKRVPGAVQRFFGAAPRTHARHLDPRISSTPRREKRRGSRSIRGTQETRRRLPAAFTARVMNYDVPRKTRAQGMPGAGRTRSLARKRKKRTSKSPQVGRTFRHSPRDGFLRNLPGDRAFLPPSPARCASIATELTSASRSQDHTTSPSAIVPFVLRHHVRPSHPAPNVRDDRDTPLFLRAGCAEMCP